MLAVVRLSRAAFTDAPSMQTLAEIAAVNELVLVCDHDAGPSVVGVLRAALPRRRIVALLVDGGFLPHERELIEELLNEGTLPVILTAHAPVADLTRWLDADTDFDLPGDARAA